MSRSTDFEAIIIAARSGAEWAWTALYQDLSPRVLRYLRAHKAIEPEDLLGDVFVQVVRKIHTFDGDESDFARFVFTIARNRMIDDWRRRGRRPTAFPLDEVPEAYGALTGDLTDEVMSRLGEQRVRAIIEDLPQSQRDVVFLRVLAGLTCAEAAAVLGRSVGAVKSLQTRAFIGIRRAIARSGETL